MPLRPFSPALNEREFLAETQHRGRGSLDCGTFFGRFHINPATGLQVGHEVILVQWRPGRKLVVWPPAVSQARLLYPRRRKRMTIREGLLTGARARP